MYVQVEKPKGNKSSTVANSVAQRKSSVKQGFGFMDNRPEAIAQRKLQEMANNSPQGKQAAQLQALADNYSARQQQPIEKKENNTGLPDNLKTGIENLSGYSMDDVKVHYNSDKPSQLQAHAYAQGTDIHLASGQEKHLPHEAWHVVQQMQGRVKPTLQMKGVAINDDRSLEREADKMGVKAASINKSRAIANSVAQKKSNVKQGFGFVDNRPGAIIKSTRESQGLKGERQLSHTKNVTQRLSYSDQYGQPKNITTLADLEVAGGLNTPQLNHRL